MQAITTIGLDIAKSVFQVHGIDAEGNVTLRRRVKRRYVLAFFQRLLPCLVGIEACASSHHWSRELQALGHTVRLMPPAYVKPYQMFAPRRLLSGAVRGISPSRKFRGGTLTHVGRSIGGVPSKVAASP
jgi:transposase